jgi:hypothetical protein
MFAGRATKVTRDDRLPLPRVDRDATLIEELERV